MRIKPIQVGLKNKKENCRRMMSKALRSRLMTSHLLALNTAGYDSSGAVAITILHITLIGHMNFLGSVADQFNGATHYRGYGTAEATFAQ